MATDDVYIYLVEGQTEEQAVKMLKEKYILSGKIRILHQRKINNTLLRIMSPNSKVIIIFDTDVSNTVHTLDLNLNILKQEKIETFLIPQVNNFEDEIVYSTSVKNIKEILNSKSNSDFKSDFLKEKDCLKKLEDKDFDINKFWSRTADKNSPFSKYNNNSKVIKIN
ncbi:hypothetical protein [Treponema putidum]|uniref:hypothetical protein n=1 Tax=Treponema putidum TaxID=221027 RepID=UPI0021027EEB|nr:hypothetical protein [Treponema putidum]UTY30487.1 hypothetical protein E4N75_02190 [Treponema putidum]